MRLQDELCRLMNRYSQENKSNTPDFVLSNYLMACLTAFDAAVNNRSDWYGRHDSPGQSDLAALKAENERLTDILGNPQKWMLWCDERMLDENEKLRADLDYYKRLTAVAGAYIVANENGCAPDVRKRLLADYQQAIKKERDGG